MYYACMTCNRLKRDYWPSVAERAAGCVVLNPCDFRMSDHLWFQGDLVKARSGAGHWNEALFDLNAPDALDLRELVRAMLEMFNDKIGGWNDILAQIKYDLEHEPDSTPHRANLEQARAKVSADIADARRLRARLVGGVA